jgi:hypothetical protein
LQKPRPWFLVFLFLHYNTQLLNNAKKGRYSWITSPLTVTSWEKRRLNSSILGKSLVTLSVNNFFQREQVLLWNYNNRSKILLTVLHPFLWLNESFRLQYLIFIRIYFNCARTEWKFTFQRKKSKILCQLWLIFPREFGFSQLIWGRDF